MFKSKTQCTECGAKLQHFFIKYKRIESGLKLLKRVSPVGMKTLLKIKRDFRFSLLQQVQVLMASSAVGKGEPYTTRVSVCARLGLPCLQEVASSNVMNCLSLSRY